MTIHIFGDSFACICEDDTDKCCWPHHLSKLKKESVRCFATAGSGPNDALTKLIFQLDYLTSFSFIRIALLGNGP